MTYAEAAAAVTALNVAGVKRAYTYAPRKLNSGDLPALFPTLPMGEQATIALLGQAGLPRYQVTLMLVIEPVAQGQAQPTWDRSIVLLDALRSALEDNALAIGLDAYRVRLDTVAFSDVFAAWVWICEVEVS